MTLAGGDINQYEKLKTITIQDYLIKLDTFVKSIEPESSKPLPTQRQKS